MHDFDLARVAWQSGPLPVYFRIFFATSYLLKCYIHCVLLLNYATTFNQCINMNKILNINNSFSLHFHRRRNCGCSGCNCTTNIQPMGAGNVLCTPNIRRQNSFHFSVYKHISLLSDLTFAYSQVVGIGILGSPLPKTFSTVVLVCFVFFNRFQH